MLFRLLAPLCFSLVTWSAEWNIFIAQAMAQSEYFPEASSGFTEQKGGTASRFMVVAANPIAVKAGFNAIRAGGNALDAAFTAQLVLNLVEPQSSGIGGGAFVLYWDNKEKKLHAFDGRETAPAAATEERFIRADGKVMRRAEAIIGGKSVGVPGLLHLMEMAHSRHGMSNWQDLFAPAIDIAENGFAISPRLYRLLEVEKALPQMAAAKAHYYRDDGKPKAAGTVLKNPAMAKTLRRVAQDGIKIFYTGKIAKAIVQEVREATQNPADLTLQDMSGYRALERTPMCAPYRNYVVCGAPAPTSGGIGVIQTLGILENFDLPSMDPWSLESVHLFVEASRLVYADRAKFIADPDFATVPEMGLIDRGYLADRASLINPLSSMTKVYAGEPPQKEIPNYDVGEDLERPSTTHISVIDAEGNAVSMTSSIEGAFGSHLMVDGFLLNNQLTDFSYRAAAEGRKVANRVEGGKRPRSSMAPIIVFDKNNNIVAISGSPGGMAIVPLVTKTLIAMLDWDMTPQEATNLPNVLIFGDNIFLEAETHLVTHKTAMEKMGHMVRMSKFPSGVHAIAVGNGMLRGGADPRREGAVMGE